MNKLFIFGLLLGGIAGGLAAHFGGVGGLIAMIIGQIGMVFSKASLHRFCRNCGHKIY